MTDHDKMTLDKLIKVFEHIGASNPEEWAKSQIDEGIPQIARYLFLRQAWRKVINSGDNSWMEDIITLEPNIPGSVGAEALRRMLNEGVSKRDITELVRMMQWRILFSICYLLDDPGELEDEVSDVGWSLFQTDVEGNPVAPLRGLHESVLETEPNGSEMRSSE